MRNKNELLPEQLKKYARADRIKFDTVDTVVDTTDLIYGQERGIKAFDFGLAMDVKGYNIFFEGPTGVR